ncbi:MAG: sugar phosphate isomerase/epimerase [Candidatus Omnitrophica bacterium]|nr:sugar phosphate isomerase/epimerase [Candidatus Omnitrophota bacterium]
MHDNAYSMLKEIKDLGFEHVELNFSLSKRIVDQTIELVRDGFIRVLSTHNFCPLPEGVDISKASPEYYSLASPGDHERMLALDNTKRTIDTACSLGAKAVVVHAGRTSIKDRTRELAREIEQGRDTTALLTAIKREREKELKKGYLDYLLKSLEILSSFSKSYNVKIGLENRFYYKEIPSMEEFEIIFSYFGKDSNIYYWHDTGHAQVFDNLNLALHKDYLSRFADRLIGMHLHDVKDTIDDHNAPLKGKMDFSQFSKYLSGGDVLKILEVHAKATGDDIRKGMEHLKKLYGN